MALQKLLHVTGCLEFADPAAAPDNCFTTALLSCEEHGVEHEVLSAEEVNARFPGYHLPPGFKARRSGLFLHVIALTFAPPGTTKPQRLMWTRALGMPPCRPCTSRKGASWRQRSALQRTWRQRCGTGRSCTQRSAC